MKKLYFPLLFCAICVGCSPVANPPAIVAYEGYSNNTLQLSSQGFGTNTREMEANGACNAISRVIFEGIAGSAYDRALVSSRDNKAERFMDNLKEGNWNQYVTSINQVSDAERFKGATMVAKFDVSINIQSLRRALEEEEVIRKFGL